jgi:hypothetical protein
MNNNSKVDDKMKEILESLMIDVGGSLDGYRKHLEKLVEITQRETLSNISTVMKFLNTTREEDLTNLLKELSSKGIITISDQLNEQDREED